MVKAFELASIKSSEEQVFVLAVDGDTATVRRPTGGPNGSIVHLEEQFHVAELETESERRSRVAASRLAMKNLFQQTGTTDEQSPAAVLQ